MNLKKKSKTGLFTCLKVKRGLSFVAALVEDEASDMRGEGERGHDAGDDGPLVGLSHMSVSWFCCCVKLSCFLLWSRFTSSRTLAKICSANKQKMGVLANCCSIELLLSRQGFLVTRRTEPVAFRRAEEHGKMRRGSLGDIYLAST